MLGGIGLDAVLTRVGDSGTEKAPWYCCQGLGTGDFSRSGRCTLVRGAEPAYLGGGVLQLVVSQLCRHIVLLSQR